MGQKRQTFHEAWNEVDCPCLDSTSACLPALFFIIQLETPTTERKLEERIVRMVCCGVGGCSSVLSPPSQSLNWLSFYDIWSVNLCDRFSSYQLPSYTINFLLLISITLFSVGPLTLSSSFLLMFLDLIYSIEEFSFLYSYPFFRYWKSPSLK